MVDVDCGPREAGDDFWAFSLSLYARPGVPERCLRLQDEGGLDVNLALFCLWSGLTRGAPPEAAWPAILRISEFWAGTATRPLRAIRRALKAGFSPEDGARLDVESFRAAVQRLELEAEARQQRALAPFAARPEGPPGRAAAERAFAAYLAARQADGAAAAPEEALLAACWPDLAREAQSMLLEQAATPARVAPEAPAS